VKVVIVVGSQRTPSASLRVGRHVARELESQFETDTFLLELATSELGFWDTDFSSKSGRQWQNWAPISDHLKTSDALVLVFPEWGGMAPPIMKNFMLLASKDEIGDKPALLVSVSSGMGGSYPIAELRASAGKNSRVCIIPDHMIIRKVDEVLPDTLACAPEVRDRLRYHLGNMLLYADALANVRKSVVYNPRYKFGL
jgi:NAD(P)H-dependent FMN reductase